MARGGRGSLRIVGGDWRGRRLEIAGAGGLRPTPDRVRETLFNWLAPLLPGSRCLDAFAGTGALGLEALSRGAAAVTFVERNARLAAGIERALAELGDAGRGRVLRGRSPAALDRLAGPFDLVFLDPPFADDLLGPALAALPPLLAAEHRVYLEFSAHAPPALPVGWRILRDKRAGEVGYRLACWSPDGDTRPA